MVARRPELSGGAVTATAPVGGKGRRTHAESIATIHRAIELGVTFLDTSDMYGRGANEELVGKAMSATSACRSSRRDLRHRGEVSTRSGL